MSNYQHRTWIGYKWSLWSSHAQWEVREFIKVYERAGYKVKTQRSKKFGILWMGLTPAGMKYIQCIFDTPDMLTQELLALELKEKNEQGKKP